LRLPKDIVSQIVEKEMSVQNYDLELDFPEVRNLIMDCFAKDMWTEKEACRLLAGFLPEPVPPLGFFTLDGMPLDDSAASSKLLDLEVRLMKIWKSNPDNPDRASPEKFINWAISKRFPPVWLEAVKAQGFYIDRTSPNAQSKLVGNPSTPSDWKVSARLIADEFFDRDTAMKYRDTLFGYSKKVMKEMQERKIHGPRGRIVNPLTIQRDALQAGKWWGNKPK
jgi:hypothetical protein